MNKAHILYIEDDETLSFITKDHLELQGYTIIHYADGESGLEGYQKERYDLCILDVMLPKMDGFSVAEQIRKKDQNIPIIFLTAKSMKDDKLHGLKIGGDDYLTKPFSIEELILKIEIFLKRSRGINPHPETQIKIGNYVFNPQEYEIRINDSVKGLTQRESELLHYLFLNRNKVIRRSTILESLWGRDDYFMGRSLDVFISRLRKYLSEDSQLKVENIHGIGFKFICP